MTHLKSVRSSVNSTVIENDGRKEMKLNIGMFDLTAATNESAGLQMSAGAETGLPEKPFQSDEHHIVRKPPRRFIVQRQRLRTS